MSGQSMLWGHSISFWDTWGVRAMIVGGALAFLALAVSLFSSFVLYRVAARAQADLESTTARLGQQTAEANARAKEAELALKQYKAARDLTDGQRAAIVAAIRPFDGQEYALSVAAGSEAANFVCLLANVLESAGWKRHAPLTDLSENTDCGKVGVNTLSGIDIRIALNGVPPATVAAADALIDVLRAQHVESVRGARDPLNIPIPSVIAIMVGAKH